MRQTQHLFVGQPARFSSLSGPFPTAAAPLFITFGDTANLTKKEKKRQLISPATVGLLLQVRQMHGKVVSFSLSSVKFASEVLTRQVFSPTCLVIMNGPLKCCKQELVYDSCHSGPFDFLVGGWLSRSPPFVFFDRPICSRQNVGL